jgi:hypothetical protein
MNEVELKISNNELSRMLKDDNVSDYYMNQKSSKWFAFIEKQLVRKIARKIANA